MVRPVQPETDMDRLENEGLLYIPKHIKDQNTPSASTGIVVQTGLNITHWVPGDMVMFGSLMGSRYMVDGQEIIILDEMEVMCSLEPTDESTLTVQADEDTTDKEISDAAQFMGRKKVR